MKTREETIGLKTKSTGAPKPGSNEKDGNGFQETIVSVPEEGTENTVKTGNTSERNREKLEKSEDNGSNKRNRAGNGVPEEDPDKPDNRREHGFYEDSDYLDLE